MQIYFLGYRQFGSCLPGVPLILITTIHYLPFAFWTEKLTLHKMCQDENTRC